MRTIQEAETIISLYEQNGAAKLFYALNRKKSELNKKIYERSDEEINSFTTCVCSSDHWRMTAHIK